MTCSAVFFRQARLGLLVSVALVTGCASISAQRPEIDARFANASFKTVGEQQAAPVPQQWWQEFESEQLNSLVQTALQDNPGLAAAQARFRAAQASLEGARAGFFPSLTLNAGRQENTVKGVSIQGAATNNRGLFTSASFQASYEIDLWARVRNTARAADFQLQASQFELLAGQISLAAEVANTWASWLAADQTVRLLQAELDTFETNLRLVELRFRQGSAQAANVLQQRQLVESARGSLAIARADREVILTALAQLTGQAPNTLQLQSEALPAPAGLPSTGLPAALLAQRPDVLQAWAQVEAVDRNVAAAIANRLPQLSLRASFSDQAPNSDVLFDNWVRNLSINMIAPLFDGGARAAEVDRQRALLDQAVALYQEAALQALADVDNALVQETQQAQAVKSLETQLELAEQSLTRLFAGYRNGTVDYLAILDAQQSTSQLRRNLVSARQQLLNFRISLYRALSSGIGNTKDPKTS